MTGPAAFVHIDLGGSTRKVGRLWIKADGNRQGASFEFDADWIADPLHHALGPALPPTAGAFHSGHGRAMFGALGDSAPDRWGRRLIARDEARRARMLGDTPRAPREIDFLLGVTDFVRQGALDTTASIELAIEGAAEFLLSRDEAKVIAADVARSIIPWREDAARAGIGASEMEWMESAFEHEDANMARNWA